MLDFINFLLLSVPYFTKLIPNVRNLFQHISLSVFVQQRHACKRLFFQLSSENRISEMKFLYKGNYAVENRF